MRQFLIIFLLLSAVLISGCVQAGSGFLTGKITIGPLCPVERNPPDPMCQPTAETYRAWPIDVSTPDGLKIAVLEPSLNGSYTVELAAGTYVVDLETPSGRSNLPATVTLRKNETTVLNINIDTGIR